MPSVSEIGRRVAGLVRGSTPRVETQQPEAGQLESRPYRDRGAENSRLQQFLKGVEPHIQKITNWPFPGNRLADEFGDTLGRQEPWGGSADVYKWYNIVTGNDIIDFILVPRGKYIRYSLTRDMLRAFVAFCWSYREWPMHRERISLQERVVRLRETLGKHSLGKLLNDPSTSRRSIKKDDQNKPFSQEAAVELREPFIIGKGKIGEAVLAETVGVESERGQGSNGSVVVFEESKPEPVAEDKPEFDFSGPFWETELGRAVRDWTTSQISAGSLRDRLTTAEVINLLGLKSSTSSQRFITYLTERRLIAGTVWSMAKRRRHFSQKHVIVIGLMALLIKKGYPAQNVSQKVREMLQDTDLVEFVGRTNGFYEGAFTRNEAIFQNSSPWLSFPLEPEKRATVEGKKPIERVPASLHVPSREPQPTPKPRPASGAKPRVKTKGIVDNKENRGYNLGKGQPGVIEIGVEIGEGRSAVKKPVIEPEEPRAFIPLEQGKTLETGDVVKNQRAQIGIVLGRIKMGNVAYVSVQFEDTSFISHIPEDLVGSRLQIAQPDEKSDAG